MIRKWSENIIRVNIESESQMDDKLQEVTLQASKHAECDIVVQLPFVSTISSLCITELIRLHKSLSLSGRRLILSTASSKTKEIITLTGLDNFLEIATDYNDALSKLQRPNRNLH